jgi:glucosamine--fructose-6-phosphate aminotransferase (isomerizing)
MYADLPADVRNGHPYHMYEEIHGQPEAVARSLTLAQEHGPVICRAIGRARRVFVTGCGTSLYAAQGGAWLLQSFSLGAIDARAVPAYELATYLPGLGSDDLVVAVTHSGTTTMTLRALERARRVGAESVVVTGFPESEAGRLARAVLPTGYPDERSWAHTVSYTAALVSLAAVANDLAKPSERLDLGPLPEVVAAALGLDEMIHRAAAGALISEREGASLRILLVGGGPNAVTAHEGVLKLLETSYVAASAFELEQMLHGPLASVDPATVLIVVAPPGHSTDRAAELIRAAAAIGVQPLVIAGEGNAERFPEAYRLALPDVPEVLSPIPWVVPLQLFSYFLSVGKGYNPDLLRRDDERYRAARAQYV